LHGAPLNCLAGRRSIMSHAAARKERKAIVIRMTAFSKTAMRKST
jgi:hypothetical protein